MHSIYFVSPSFTPTAGVSGAQQLLIIWSI